MFLVLLLFTDLLFYHISRLQLDYIGFNLYQNKGYQNEVIGNTFIPSLLLFISVNCV